MKNWERIRARVVAIVEQLIRGDGQAGETFATETLGKSQLLIDVESLGKPQLLINVESLGKSQL